MRKSVQVETLNNLSKEGGDKKRNSSVSSTGADELQKAIQKPPAQTQVASSSSQPRQKQQGRIPKNQKYDHMFKIIIIGDPACGKTSLLMRACLDKSNENYSVTVGVDCKSKQVQKDGKNIKLQLWDTAGQEKFRTLTTSYYRGTSCCILVFDITNIESFYHLYQWIDQYNYYCD